MNIPQFLSNIFVFESLTSEELQLIETSAAIKRVSKGALVFSDDQAASAFFIVLSGRVKLYKLSADGNEQILHIQGRGDLVAEAAIFDKATYPAFCEALEDTELMRISRDNFKELLRHNPEIMFKILNAYSKRLRYFVDLIENLSLHDIKSRLAGYLLKHCTEEGSELVCRLRMNKKNLAAVLGTIPETLSRTLNLLKRERVIKEEPDHLTILNPAKLKQLAE
ncbi:Crp/Fnr family transcriptional regulator [candidate division KSB1 bacterium]|nr:Crp/Fnr family transcriptional regulator [candidate division KSB1 bacterium]